MSNPVTYRIVFEVVATGKLNFLVWAAFTVRFCKSTLAITAVAVTVVSTSPLVVSVVTLLIKRYKMAVLSSIRRILPVPLSKAALVSILPILV